MRSILVVFVGWRARLGAAWFILTKGRVRVREAQLVERSVPSIPELCKVLVAVMCCPETEEHDREIVRRTLTGLVFPEHPRPSSGFLRTRGN